MVIVRRGIGLFAVLRVVHLVKVTHTVPIRVLFGRIRVKNIDLLAIGKAVVIEIPHGRTTGIFNTHTGFALLVIVTVTADHGIVLGPATQKRHHSNRNHDQR